MPLVHPTAVFRHSPSPRPLQSLSAGKLHLKKKKKIIFPQHESQFDSVVHLHLLPRHAPAGVSPFKLVIYVIRLQKPRISVHGNF